MPDEMQANPMGKVAIVTGASRGLGRNTAISLAERGTDVIITYHSNRAEADSVVATVEALGRKAVALQLDAGDIASFDKFAAEVQATLPARFIAAPSARSAKRTSTTFATSTSRASSF